MPQLIDSFPNWLTGAIFTRLGALFPDEIPWANQYGRYLDTEYFGNHSGSKEISPLLSRMLSMNGGQNPDVITDSQLETIANILYIRFGDTWARLYKITTLEYNPIENYSMTETETPDITHETTTKTNSDYSVTTDTPKLTSSVYGFNSSESVPQSETSGQSTVTTKGDAEKNVTVDTAKETGTRTLTREGNIGVTTSQQMIESEISLWQWNFFETVFRMVDTVLTVPKYNLCGGKT